MKRRTKKEKIKMGRKGVDSILFISWASSNIQACLGYRWTLLFTFYIPYLLGLRKTTTIIFLDPSFFSFSSSSSSTKLETDVLFVFPFVRRSSFPYRVSPSLSSCPTNDVKRNFFLLGKKILCPFILNTSRA